jgi:hypothetical protein
MVLERTEICPWVPTGPENKYNCAGEDQQLLHCFIAILNAWISVVVSPGSEDPHKVYSLEDQEIRCGSYTKKMFLIIYTFVKVNIHNHKDAGRKASFMLIAFLAYSSVLKKEATCLFETLVDFQRATRRYISVGRTLHISSSSSCFVSLCIWIGNYLRPSQATRKVHSGLENTIFTNVSFVMLHPSLVLVIYCRYNLLLADLITIRHYIILPCTYI